MPNHNYQIVFGKLDTETEEEEEEKLRTNETILWFVNVLNIFIQVFEIGNIVIKFWKKINLNK